MEEPMPADLQRLTELRKASVFLQVDNDDDRDNVFQQAVDAAHMMWETGGEFTVYDLGDFTPNENVNA